MSADKKPKAVQQHRQGHSKNVTSMTRGILSQEPLAVDTNRAARLSARLPRCWRYIAIARQLEAVGVNHA